MPVWWQAVDLRVEREGVVGALPASPYGPLAVPCWIPGKSHVRTKVVSVGCWLAEDKTNRRIIRNRVQRLLSFVTRHSGPFIPQSKVDGKPRQYLPIILNEPVNSWIVVRRACCSRAAERSIRAVGYKVIDERVERGVVPFAARSWQRSCFRDVIPPLDSKLKRMLSPNVTYVLNCLINILHVPLRRETVRTQVAAEWIDFHVGKISKLTGRQSVWPVQPRKGQTKVVNHIAADCPGVGENVLPRILLMRAGKLTLWLDGVHLRESQPVVKNTSAKLVPPQVQIAIDRKIVFPGVARSNPRE